MANDKNPQNKTEHRDKEEIRLKKEEQARRGRRRMRQLIGLALTVLIVVGAYSIITSGIDLAQNMLDDTNETDDYQRRITPLVWFDVLPFESLGDADPNALKQAVIWGVLNEMGSEVEYNEYGQPQVPAVEVDRYAAELFGPDYIFEHASFEDPVQDLSYEYDPVTNMYSATATGLTPLYTPTVVSIERMGGGIKKVTAGYVSTLNSNDELIATPDYSSPSRYKDFYFRRDGSEYYLYALRANTTYVPESGSSTAQAGLPAASLDESGLTGPSSVPTMEVELPESASLAEYEESTPSASVAEESETSGSSSSTSASSASE